MAHSSRSTTSSPNKQRKPGHHERKLKAAKAKGPPRSSVAQQTELRHLDTPTVDELREARSHYYSNVPEEQKRSVIPGMAYSSEIRSTAAKERSTSKVKNRSGSRGRRHKHRSDRDHRSQKISREKPSEGPVYVYDNSDDREVSSEEEKMDGANLEAPPLPSRTVRRGSVNVEPARTLRSNYFDAQWPTIDHLPLRRPRRFSIRDRDLEHNPAAPRVAHGSLPPGHTKQDYYTTTVERVELPRKPRNITTRGSSQASSSRPLLRRSKTTTRAHPPSPNSDSGRPRAPTPRRALSQITSPTNTAVEKKEVHSSRSKPLPSRAGIFAPLSIVLGRNRPPAPVKKIECLTCLSDDIPITKSAKLKCGHHMCHDCLKRIFTMSVTDPQHMPPKCCTQDHIPLQHVDRLFSTAFKVKWNKKYQEYTTKNRIYCPSKGCGEWIRPANIHLDTSSGAMGGRKYGKCGRCKTKVCCSCNGKWHTGKLCLNDEDTKQFFETAKKEGWQKCYNCSAMVELKEGCNHMTCRCTAEFCIICARKWKTCDCPWFNYDAVENDRLNHMNVPLPIRPRQLPPQPLRPAEFYDNYLRRRQEEQDEAMARRLQALGLDSSDDDDTVEPGNRQRRMRNEPDRRAEVGAAIDLLTGPYGGGRAAAGRRQHRHLMNDPAVPDIFYRAITDSMDHAEGLRRALELAMPPTDRLQQLPHAHRGASAPVEPLHDAHHRQHMVGRVAERRGGRVGNWLEELEHEH